MDRIQVNHLRSLVVRPVVPVVLRTKLHKFVFGIASGVSQ